MQTKQNNKKTVTATLVPFIVEKSLSQLMAQVVTDDKGNASFAKGATLSPSELGYMAAETMKGVEGATLRAANILRLARQLPPLKEGEKEREAFDVAGEQFRARMTDSAFYNMLGMVTAIDIVEINKLTVSPFAVKETLGTLNALGALPDKKAIAGGAKLKLTNGKARPIVALLKSGEAKVNAIRETIAKVKGTPAKKPAADNAGGGKGGDDKSKDTNSAPFTVESLSFAAIALRGQWEKTVEKHGMKAVRASLVQDVYILAKLAGLNVAEPEKTPAVKPEEVKK